MRTSHFPDWASESELLSHQSTLNCPCSPATWRLSLFCRLCRFHHSAISCAPWSRPDRRRSWNLPERYARWKRQKYRVCGYSLWVQPLLLYNSISFRCRPLFQAPRNRMLFRPIWESWSRPQSSWRYRSNARAWTLCPVLSFPRERPTMSC